MKSSATTMYKVGKIFNLVEIVLSLLAMFGGMFVLIFKNEIAEQALESGNAELSTVGAVERMGIIMLITSAVIILISLVIFICASKADRFTRENKDTYVDHTTMIVIGIIGNIFYLIGGIFGIIYTNQKEVEQKRTEEKETKNKKDD